jgi:hypothetical protein
MAQFTNNYNNVETQSDDFKLVKAMCDEFYKRVQQYMISSYNDDMNVQDLTYHMFEFMKEYKMVSTLDQKITKEKDKENNT